MIFDFQEEMVGGCAREPCAVGYLKQAIGDGSVLMHKVLLLQKGLVRQDYDGRIPQSDLQGRSPESEVSCLLKVPCVLQKVGEKLTSGSARCESATCSRSA